MSAGCFPASHSKQRLTSNLHLEPLLHRSSALQVLGGGVDVVLHLFFAKIDHVGGEEGSASLLELLLIGVEHTVEPWQELLTVSTASVERPRALSRECNLRAVVGVENDGDAVDGSNGSDIMSSGNGASDGSLLFLGAVGNALACEEGSTALGTIIRS